MSKAASVTRMLHSFVESSESVEYDLSALREATRAQVPGERARASAQLSASSQLFVRSYSLLRDEVLAMDGEIAGNRVASLGELGIRAQTYIALLTLDELRELTAFWPSECAALFSGRDESFARMVGDFFERIGAVNALWYPPQPRAASKHSTEGRFRTRQSYRFAIHAARQQLTQLVDSPRWVQFNEACTRLTTVPGSMLVALCELMTEALTFRAPVEFDHEDLFEQHCARPGAVDVRAHV